MEQQANLKEEKVPLKSRIWVSAADGGVAILQTVIGGGALTYYFTRVRLLDPGLAGIVLIIFGIWNIINDPIFGYISDRTRSKLGRRKPYIRYGGPIIGLSYILCWINWPGSQTDQFTMFFQFLIFLFFYDTLYTAVATSLYVMPFEMAVSNKARGSIFIWKVLFSVIATLLPLIVIPIIQPGPGDDPTSYQVINIALGAIIGLLVFVSSFFYEEKHYLQEEEKIPFLKSLKSTFKNRSFLIFEVISFTVIYVQSGLMFGLFYYLDELESSMILLFSFLGIGILVGLYLFVVRGRKFGVKKSMQIMLSSFSFCCFLILFLGRNLIAASIGFIGIGLGLAGGLYLIPLMNGDVIDKDEDMTGQRREGMYAGVNSFITKYAISLAQAAFLFIVGAFGYISTLPKGAQDYNAETGIIIGWMLIPAILLLACFLTMYIYPLDGPEWNSTKERIAELHKKKEIEILEKLGYKFVE